MALDRRLFPREKYRVSVRPPVSESDMKPATRSSTDEVKLKEANE